MPSYTELVAAERQRQIDDAKRDKKDRLRQLVVAGALLAAEYDRLVRLNGGLDAS